MANKRTIRNIEFSQVSVLKVYVKRSDEEAGSKAIILSYLGRRTSQIPIEKSETDISINKVPTSPPIKHNQFSLTLEWSSAVQKVQDLSSEQGVIGFDLQQQKPFGPEEMYTALSRVKSYDNCYCIGEFKRHGMKAN